MKNNNPRKSGGASITTRDMMSVFAVVLVVFITVLFIAMNFNTENEMAVDDRYDSFSSGWRLNVDGVEKTVDLPYYTETQSNAIMTISKEIPEIPEYYAVVTRNYHKKMRVYVDDALVYEFPEEDMVFSEAVITDDWNMIRLNKDMSGKPLRIEFETGESGFKAHIQNVYLGEDNALIYYIRAITSVPYAMSASIVAIGLALLLLGFLYAKYSKDKTQIFIGLMLITLGLWMTNRSKMPILMVGSSIKYFLAFLSLSIETILVLLYVLEKFKNNNRIQRLTKRLILGFGIFLTGAIVFALWRGIPLDQMVKFDYGSIFLVCLYMVIMLWTISYGKEKQKYSEKERNINKMEFWAANIMTFGVVVGIIYDFFMNHNRMWTDIGTVSKIVVNIYAITQVAIHIYRSYHAVSEREEIRGQLHDSQIELMMGQIQPHFMFNTLSSIRTLVKVDPDVAYDMIYNFSNYLRANVDNMTNMDGIQFAAELEHIKSYVNIERVRFGDRLKVEYDAQVTEFMVPPLSIQPIVENAIKHGVCKKPGGGTVWLRSYEEGDYNVVEIQDDGVGFDPELLKALKDGTDAPSGDEVGLTGNGSEQHKSTGMKNIMMRLKEMANADMIIESQEGEGTKIKVLFPKDLVQ